MPIEIQFQTRALEGEARTEVLDHLNATLRSSTHIWATTSGRVGDIYETKIYTRMHVAGRLVDVVWYLDLHPDGKIPWIRVSTEDPAIRTEELQHSVSEFLRRVFDQALSDSLLTFVIRRYFSYFGQPLDGEYWLQKCRIAPLVFGDSFDADQRIEQFLVLDQEVRAIDKDHAWRVASDRAITIAARLALFLNVGLRLPIEEWRWVKNDQETGTVSRRLTSLPESRYFLERLPKRGEECPSGGWAGHLLVPPTKGSPLSCPKQIRRIFRAVEQSDSSVRTAFDGCARLYQLALVIPSESYSAKLALKVAAVEALAQATPQLRGFSAFVRRYYPAAHDIEDLLDRLYGGVRSRFLHAGLAYLDDFLRATELTDRHGRELLDFGMQAEHVLRYAIVQWMEELISGIDSAGGQTAM